MWAAAWLHGRAAPDDVIDAVGAWGPICQVRAADEITAAELDLPGPDDAPTGLVALLTSLRRAGTSDLQLVLPVPGDVRGLPADGELSRAALEASEAVLVPGAELGLVPTLSIVDSTGAQLWTVYRADRLPPLDEPPLSDAEYGLQSAVRQAARTLADLGVAKHKPGVRDEIAQTLQARAQHEWPEGMPGKALRVLARADEVAAILAAAGVDELGGAVSASAADARTAALRPLGLTVREARRAAIGAAVRMVGQGVERY